MDEHTFSDFWSKSLEGPWPADVKQRLGEISNPLETSHHPDDAMLKAAYPYVAANPAADYMVRMRAEQREAERSENAEPFRESEAEQPEPEASENIITFGRTASQRTAWISPVSMCSGVCVAGKTRRGKTSAIQPVVLQSVSYGATVIVLDFKGTWRDLLRLPGVADRAMVVSMKELRLSLCQPPPGCSLTEWWSTVVNIFGSAYARIRAHQLLFQCFEDCQRDLPDAHRPTLSQIVAKAYEIASGPRNYYTELAKGLHESLVNMQRETEHIFEVHLSDMAERMFNTPGRLIIIEDQGANIEHVQFLMGWLFQWIYRFRKTNHLISSDLHIVQFVLEDASNLLDERLDMNTTSGTSPFAMGLDVSGEYLISVLSMVHSLRTLSPKICRSMNNWISVGVQGEDVELVKKYMGLTRSQGEALLRLSVGEGIALIPSVNPRPVFFSYPKLEVPSS